jgi:hypothetical protein
MLSSHLLSEFSLHRQLPRHLKIYLQITLHLEIESQSYLKKVIKIHIL